jgi:glycosyltransferase involved in cell wall biosynthesis
LRESAIVRADGVAGPTPASPNRRVLILRSCRPAEFAAAVRFARLRHPGHELVALSHKGHSDRLLAAGVDDVFELPGTRFGPTRVAPWHLLKLRSVAFEEIVVPQMSASPGMHRNLYGLVALLRFTRVVILPGSEPAQVLERGAFLSMLAYLTLEGVIDLIDLPLLLMLLLAARFFPRRRVSPVSQRKRRVLHVIPSLGMGGAQRQLFEVVNATPADQYDVDVIVLCDFGNGFARQWLTRDEVRIEYLRHYPRMAFQVWEIAQRCRDREYDLVHTWLWLANWIGVAGARLGGVPFVVTAVRSLSVHNRKLGYGRWWHPIADALGSRAADVVTVNAEALARNYARWAVRRRSQIDVVHNGLDPSHFLVDRRDARQRLLEAIDAPERAVLIGTVGRLSPEKNHSLFLDVIRDVHRLRPDVRGVVIGDGALQSALEQQATEMGLEDIVTFLGQRTDPVRLMAGLDLFVLPSLIEGFPNALLEAVFLGIPALATDVGGNPDVLGDADLLFDVRSQQLAVSMVLATLDDPDRAAVRADRARRRSLDLFTADRTMARWLRLYDRCWEGAQHA